MMHSLNTFLVLDMMVVFVFRFVCYFKVSCGLGCVCAGKVTQRVTQTVVFSERETPGNQQGNHLFFFKNTHTHY